MIVRVVIFFAIVGAALAQSPSPSARDVPVLIQLPNSQISDFIKFYQSLTKRKVWIDAQLRFDRKASIMSQHPIPRAEAVALIKDTLRKEGVEIREVGDSEAYVSSAAP
ncbi:MAG TPA: hypothetical protein VNW72_09090 [Chthoniobacterales bacterium]|jgi:hypothetical protein|nr:hypothetical protein [Chthoniobacterales bacterium]